MLHVVGLTSNGGPKLKLAGQDKLMCLYLPRLAFGASARWQTSRPGDSSGDKCRLLAQK